MARKLSVTAPNGKTYDIEAPDDATDDQIHAEVLRVHPEAASASDSQDQGGVSIGPDGRLLIDIVGQKQPEDRPISQSQGFAEGFEKPLNNAADWLTQGLNNAVATPEELATGSGGILKTVGTMLNPVAMALGAIGGSNPQLPTGDAINKLGAETLGMAPSVQAARQTQQAALDSSPYQSGGLGKFAGEVTGAALLSRLPGGAFSQGAQAGALLTDTPNDIQGVATDAAIGGTAGRVGSAALNAVGRVAAPTINNGLRTLLDAGIRVTPGQAARSTGTAAGRFFGAVEDKAMSRPFVGGVITAGRNDSLNDFARATINRAVQPIGEELPARFDLRTTAGARNAVRWAGDRLSAEYNDLSPRIRMNGNDPQFINDLTEIQNAAADMVEPRQRQFQTILGGLERFWRANGTELNGQAFRDVDTRLGENIRRFATSQDADQRQLGEALQSVRDSMYEAAMRQNPEIAGRMQALNTGWRSLVQVERAAGTSKGLPTPSGYSQAVKMSSDTVRRRGYSRGGALNQDLSDAASDILPSSIADSGTAGRIGGFRAGALGLAQALPYLAAQRVSPLLLRQNGVSPGLAQLLQYGARTIPYAAPPLISQSR
jgi:hypothetical protein